MLVQIKDEETKPFFCLFSSDTLAIPLLYNQRVFCMVGKTNRRVDWQQRAAAVPTLFRPIQLREGIMTLRGEERGEEKEDNDDGCMNIKQDLVHAP